MTYCLFSDLKSVIQGFSKTKQLYRIIVFGIHFNSNAHCELNYPLSCQHRRQLRQRECEN